MNSYDYDYNRGRGFEGKSYDGKYEDIDARRAYEEGRNARWTNQKTESPIPEVNYSADLYSPSPSAGGSHVRTWPITLICLGIVFLPIGVSHVFKYWKYHWNDRLATLGGIPVWRRYDVLTGNCIGFLNANIPKDSLEAFVSTLPMKNGIYYAKEFPAKWFNPSVRGKHKLYKLYGGYILRSSLIYIKQAPPHLADRHEND